MNFVIQEIKINMTVMSYRIATIRHANGNFNKIRFSFRGLDYEGEYKSWDSDGRLISYFYYRNDHVIDNSFSISKKRHLLMLKRLLHVKANIRKYQDSISFGIVNTDLIKLCLGYL